MDYRQLLKDEILRRQSNRTNQDNKLEGLLQQNEKLVNLEPSVRTDLTPMASFVDQMTGSNLARTVKAPESTQDALRKALQARIQAPKQDMMKPLQMAMKDDQARDAIRAKLAANKGKGSEKLRAEWLKNPTTKATQEVATAFNKVQSSAENQSAAGDLSLIFNYMKMLDPGSVVREGEFATAQNAAGIPDRIRNKYNQLMSGERLNPEQRQDFLNQAGNTYKAQLASQENVNRGFSSLANRLGANPENVVLNDFFSLRSGQQGGQQRSAPIDLGDGDVIDPSKMSDEQLDEMIARMGGK